jgi:uncharacterized protein Yka (UPF0111/DUF47 family)
LLTRAPDRLAGKVKAANPMLSIQKYFSKDAKFFDLLEASADETRALTQLLIQLLQNGKHSRPLDDFAFERDKDKRITEQISEELVNTFITGLEREDIETLSYSMYRICKVIEKFAERYNLAPERLADIDFAPQVVLMQRATETLTRMVRLLRKMPPLETVKAMNDQLQSIESEADEVMLNLLREIYGGRFDPLQAMMLRDLYDLLERAIDRCRDCGNAISHIVMKNS